MGDYLFKYSSAVMMGMLECLKSFPFRVMITEQFACVNKSNMTLVSKNNLFIRISFLGALNVSFEHKNLMEASFWRTCF